MKSISRQSITTYLIPGILILVNIVIKFAVLDFRDISHDEPFTIFHAQYDLKSLFGIFAYENNPPLFFLIMHYWIKIFGISSVSVRFLPMVFSVLTVPILYKTGLKFYNASVAVLVVVLFSFSNYHLLFSHDTRVYSLFGLLTCASFYAFFSILQEEGKPKYSWILIASNVLLLYAHFFGFFIPFIQFIIVFVLEEKRKKYLVKILKYSAITFAFYIPYLSTLLKRFAISSSSGTWLEPPNLEAIYNTLWKFSNAPVATVLFVLILISGILFWIFKKKKVKVSFVTKSIVIWFLLPFLLIFSISFFIPMYLDRYLVFFSFAFYFLVAISVISIFRNVWIKYSVILLLSLLMIVTFKPKNNIYRIKDLVKEINMQKDDNTALIMAPAYFDKTFTYHYNIEYFKDYRNLESNLKSDNIFPVFNISGLNIEKVQKLKKVIYIDIGTTATDSKKTIHKFLETNFNLESVNEGYHSYKVYYYTIK